ncbi:MAG: hypothetical protein WAM44_16880 [Chthoniobacterales bacterium]
MSTKMRQPLGFFLAVVLAGPFVGTQAATPASETPNLARDGQHDFDFNIGTWKTHIRRLLHPLSGSDEWVELDGTLVVRKVWGGHASSSRFPTLLAPRVSRRARRLSLLRR